MSYSNKPFEELDVLDNFLMNAIATDKDVGEAFCRKVLSVLLQRKIGKVRVVAQYTLPAQNPRYRGIRMDVKVEHSRYMKRGDDDFSRMPNLFVITILNFDPFGYDYMMYTFENRCTEVEGLKYEDGLKFIYFYTGGTKGGNGNIKTMLQYLHHSTADNAMDDTTKELHGYVSRVKTAPEIKEEYMRFEEFLAYERKEAAQEAAQDTRIQSILELLEDYGEIPESLKEELQCADSDTLRRYHKLAAKADSIEAFTEMLCSHKASQT